MRNRTLSLAIATFISAGAVVAPVFAVAQAAGEPSRSSAVQPSEAWQAKQKAAAKAVTDAEYDLSFVDNEQKKTALAETRGNKEIAEAKVVAEAAAESLKNLPDNPRTTLRDIRLAEDYARSTAAALEKARSDKDTAVANAKRAAAEFYQKNYGTSDYAEARAIATKQLEEAQNQLAEVEAEGERELSSRTAGIAVGSVFGILGIIGAGVVLLPLVAEKLGIDLPFEVPELPVGVPKDVRAKIPVEWPSDLRVSSSL